MSPFLVHESDRRRLALSHRNPIQGILYNKENTLFCRKRSLVAQRLWGWLIQSLHQEPMSFPLAALSSSAYQPLPHCHKMVATAPAVTYRCPSIQWEKNPQTVSSLCLFLRARKPRGELCTFHPCAPRQSRARQMCSAERMNPAPNTYYMAGGEPIHLSVTQLCHL